MAQVRLRLFVMLILVALTAFAISARASLLGLAEVLAALALLLARVTNR